MFTLRGTPQERLTIVPLTLDDECEVVNRLHHHHKKTRGHRFSLGVRRPNGALCGVAIVGRPVARSFDNRLTVEVTRVATDGTRTRAAPCTGRPGAPHPGWKPIAELRPRTGWDTPSGRREDRGTDGVCPVSLKVRHDKALTCGASD
ncbi:XF1762 family protein [Streptomyces sp. PTD5-9]|uniref:XF1762 family protein n=1 Tax=Streptomyces sp. PTD5-9 TaxID=3120150 RepID=UPI003009E75F